MKDGLVRRGTCPPVGKIADVNAIHVQNPAVKRQTLCAPVSGAANGVTPSFAPVCRADRTARVSAVNGFVAQLLDADNR